MVQKGEEDVRGKKEKAEEEDRMTEDFLVSSRRNFYSRWFSRLVCFFEGWHA